MTDMNVHSNHYSMLSQKAVMSRFACPDYAMTSAHTAFFAVCAFLFAVAGSMIAVSSSAAIIAISIIMSIICIHIMIQNAIMKHNNALRRQ